MDSSHPPSADPDSLDADRRPLTWSDAPPSGHADPILWQHEVNAPEPARITSGRGKIIAAVIATGVFLATGFAVGAPIYALSRWWASTPLATMESAVMVPVTEAAEVAQPIHAAPYSAAAAQQINLDEEVLIATPPFIAAPATEIASDEAPASPEVAAEDVVSEPPPAATLRSESPPPAPPAIASSALDSAANEGVRIDPVTIDRVTIDPVTIERVRIDPVVIDRVRIDPVKIDPVKIDRVTIDPVPINLPESGPAGGR